MINHGFWILKHDKPWILDGSIRFYTKNAGLIRAMAAMDGQNHRTLGISIRQRPTRSRDPIRASVRPAISERSLISFLHSWCAVWVRYVSFIEFPQHILTHVWHMCLNGGKSRKSMNKDIRVSTMKKRYFPPVQMDLSVHTYQCIMILTMLYSSFTARQYGGPPGRRLG